jgi:hypothetical protein
VLFKQTYNATIDDPLLASDAPIWLPEAHRVLSEHQANALRLKVPVESRLKVLILSALLHTHKQKHKLDLFVDIHCYIVGCFLVDLQVCLNSHTRPI